MSPRPLETPAATVDRICSGLSGGLTRWIGAEGYRALLHRALENERTKQQIPLRLQGNSGDGAVIEAAVTEHGGEAVARALVSLVESLIELLGRVVGEDMAVQLVEQAWRPCGPPKEESGGHDG